MPRKTPDGHRINTSLGIVSVTHFLNKKVKRWQDAGIFPIYYNINRKGVPYTHVSMYREPLRPEELKTAEVQKFIEIETRNVLAIVHRYGEDKAAGNTERMFKIWSIDDNVNYLSWLESQEEAEATETEPKHEGWDTPRTGSPPDSEMINAYLSYYQSSAEKDLFDKIRSVVSEYASAAINKRFGISLSWVVDFSGIDSEDAISAGVFRILKKWGTTQEKRLFALWQILRDINGRLPKNRAYYPLTRIEAQQMTVEGMMRELRKIRPSILSGLWDLLGDITRETVEKRLLPLLRNVTNG